jgi:hypothetical protein
MSHLTAESIPPQDLSLEESLRQTISSLRLFAVSMGLRKIDLSEDASESGYHCTAEDIMFTKVRDEMIETGEIQEKLSEMRSAIEELGEFSSICTKCAQYCASYICPFCHVFLYCVLCKELGAECPSCGGVFAEPLRLNKTCYFGREFTIEILRQRELGEKKEDCL